MWLGSLTTTAHAQSLPEDFCKGKKASGKFTPRVFWQSQENDACRKSQWHCDRQQDTRATTWTKILDLLTLKDAPASQARTLLMEK
mmetsp:Transcript_72885/g.133295  ORF Transcript_72885/g.133295 Transcript_72885/m.133295 type:complete len:86 (-) Transcript_72885:1365-1622(-)